jgi:hypothetical protein
VLDLREGVGKQAADHLLGAVHHVPVCDDLGLFRAFVPDGAHDEKSWLANSLEDTEECSDGDKSWESEAYGMQAQNRRPGHDIEAEEFGYRDTLDGPINRVLDDKDSQIDTGGQPSELHSD